MEHTCQNCRYGGWYRNGYDVTMMDEECGGCTESSKKWEPKMIDFDGHLENMPDDIMEERLENNIRFVRTMYVLATKAEDKRVMFDAETLKNLLDLLKECKDILI